jgi:hypothetical protein
VIEITRKLARQVRAVFRRIVRHGSISFHTSSEGLQVRLAHADGAVEYHEPASFRSEVIVLPLDALADFEGRTDAPVTLESSGPGHVLARWQDGSVPQVKEYEAEAANKLPKFPDAPERMAAVEPAFLKALDEALHSASRDAVRYATNHLQIQGRSGKVVATDGRQLLLQSGFQLPFAEDVLIPATPVFGCRELTSAREVSIAKTATHVALRMGAWTLYLLINKEGRFPNTEQVIPSLAGKITCLRIDPGDAAFLAKALPRLPGADAEHAPVTIDLGGQAVLRAKGEDQSRPTELVLAQSVVSGPPIRFHLDRQYLARALDLGFGELCVVDGKAPLVFRDEKRTFIAVPLDKKAALEPADNALRISSAGTDLPDKPARVERAEPLTEPLEAESEKNGSAKVSSMVTHNGQRKSSAGSLNALVEEAEALKDELRHIYTRTHRLLAGLKKHRRQSKLVQTTLATLRQLKAVEG